jgi:hypothetical protein
VFVAKDPDRKPRRGRWIAAAGVAVLALAGVGVAVAWPALKRWWNPVPPDPVETVAAAYLDALATGNSEVVDRLGTVETPPAIRSVRSVHRDRPRDRRLKGSFAPITAFHAKVNEDYVYDPSMGRYQPRNPLATAAETLDALHDAKAKNEQDKVYEKMKSGNPDDLFDAAEGLAKSMAPIAALADGALAPKKLIPTYEQLLKDAKPPLPATERELALDFAQNRDTWDRLLKRPFATLKADGPFVLDRSEVTATAVDALGSSGDPPTPLRLTLTRFRLEAIDTGWRVTSARREGATAAPPAAPTTAAPAAPTTAPPAEKPRPY